MSVHVPWHARGGQRTTDGSHFFPSLWVQTASLRSNCLYPLSHFISPSVLILQRSKQKISGPNHRLFQGSGIFLSRIKEIQAYVTLQDWFFQLLLSCIWLPQCPPTAGVTAARSQRTSSLQASLSAIATSPSSGSGVNYLGKMEESGKRPEALC